MLINREHRFHAVMDETSVYEVDDALYAEMQEKGMSDEDILEETYFNVSEDKRQASLVMNCSSVDEVTQTHADDFVAIGEGSAAENGYADIDALVSKLEEASGADLSQGAGQYAEFIAQAAALLKLNADRLNKEIPVKREASLKAG